MPEEQQQPAPGEQQQQQENAYTAPATQADLDRIVEGRLAQERKKYEGFDDLKSKAQKWDELEDGKKTPDQKAIDDARADAESSTTQKFLSKLVGSEVKAIASTLKFNDPSDALAVLQGLEELPVKDDEPDTEAIKKLVEKLAGDKPYLVAGEVKRPAPRSTAKKGEPVDNDGAQQGKGKAAAALRQLGAGRKRTSS